MNHRLRPAIGFSAAFLTLCALASSAHASSPGVASRPSPMEALKNYEEQQRAKAAAERRAKLPRWSITAGGLLSISGSEEATYLAPSLQAGVRRWLGDSFIATGLIEYSYMRWVTAFDGQGAINEEGKRWQTSHSIALIGRFELGMRSAGNPALGIPKFSIYPLAGLVTVFGDGPGAGFGYRLGFGFQINEFILPVSLEIAYKHTFYDKHALPGFHFNLGVLAF